MTNSNALNTNERYIISFNSTFWGFAPDLKTAKARINQVKKSNETIRKYYRNIVKQWDKE